MADGKERPIHENHRARMQERVAHNGMESLAEHEVLEYMLYLACLLYTSDAADEL